MATSYPQSTPTTASGGNSALVPQQTTQSPNRPTEKPQTPRNKTDTDDYNPTTSRFTSSGSHDSQTASGISELFDSTLSNTDTSRHFANIHTDTQDAQDEICPRCGARVAAYADLCECGFDVGEYRKERKKALEQEKHLAELAKQAEVVEQEIKNLGEKEDNHRTEKKVTDRVTGFFGHD